MISVLLCLVVAISDGDTLEIDKLKSGLYRAAVTVNRSALTEPSINNSIQQAIREEALSMPYEMGRFFEVRYGGMLSGTYLLSEVPEKASAIADRLVEFMAELHRHIDVKR
jgi:hypothetical protein